jgi:hypothetical protein
MPVSPRFSLAFLSYPGEEARGPRSEKMRLCITQKKAEKNKRKPGLVPFIYM